MTRGELLSTWNAAWDGQSWVAPWDKAIDLTLEQAAAHPAPGRHSIWQLVAHVCFWREVTLDTLAGKSRPSAAVLAAENFPEPSPATARDWINLRERLHSTHLRIAQAIADPAVQSERLIHHLYHDAYHLGQIMSLRAMLGMKPIE